jgi:FAD/FMN-containing dehydrogenase
MLRVGGSIRKDVAGYDLRSLLVGSEGTLPVITALHLRFIPAPEIALLLVCLYPDARTGKQRSKLAWRVAWSQRRSSISTEARSV